MSQYITLVIKMPAAAAARTEIVNEVRALAKRQGGEVTATTNEDDVTLSELYEARLSPSEVEEARRQALRLARQEK